MPAHTSSSIAGVHFRGSNQKDKKWYGVEKKEKYFLCHSLTATINLYNQVVLLLLI